MRPVVEVIFIRLEVSTVRIHHKVIGDSRPTLHFFGDLRVFVARFDFVAYGVSVARFDRRIHNADSYFSVFLGNNAFVYRYDFTVYFFYGRLTIGIIRERHEINRFIHSVVVHVFFDVFGNGVHKSHLNARRPAVQGFVRFTLFAVARAYTVGNAEHKIRSVCGVHVFIYKRCRSEIYRFLLGIAYLIVVPQSYALYLFLPLRADVVISARIRCVPTLFVSDVTRHVGKRLAVVAEY